MSRSSPAARAWANATAALIGKPDATARELIEAAKSDPRAKKLLENSLLSIASYMGQLINILDPAIMVIGGGIGSNPEINTRLGELTRPFIFADLARDLPIVPASLGDNASVIGVAALAYRAGNFNGMTSVWRRPWHTSPRPARFSTSRRTFPMRA